MEKQLLDLLSDVLVINEDKDLHNYITKHLENIKENASLIASLKKEVKLS